MNKPCTRPVIHLILTATALICLWSCAGPQRVERGLHETAELGDVKAAEDALERGSYIDAVDDEGQTALMVAVRHNQIPMMESLLRKGANVHHRGPDGETALRLALDLPTTEALTLLLEHGADPNEVYERGYRPLHLTAGDGYTEAIVQLLLHGADVDARSEEGRTPLFVTTYGDHLLAAEVLLDFGADVDAADAAGRTPLRHAVRKDSIDTAELFVSIGADLSDDAGLEEHTLLTWAVENGHYHLVEILLDRGVDSNRRDASGRTALEAALEADDPQMIDLLRSHPAGQDGTTY